MTEHKKYHELTSLRKTVQRLETQGRQRWESQGVSTGVNLLDQLLPTGGLVRGTLVEWFMGSGNENVGGIGAGAGALALRAACEAARDGGYVIVFDRLRRFFPPAAVAWGLDLRQVVLVRAASVRDELWALEQSLRCEGVAAVWGFWDDLDWRWFRRLQLSAEQGGTLAMLVRPGRFAGQPSWADVQWCVRPLSPNKQSPQKSDSAWRLSVTLKRCRGGVTGKTVHVPMETVYRTASVVEGPHEGAADLPPVGGQPGAANHGAG
jgi:hypothetical protein